MEAFRRRLGDALIRKGNSIAGTTNNMTESSESERKNLDPEVRRLLGIAQVADSHLGLSEFLEFEAGSEESGIFQHELILNLIRNYEAFTLPDFDNGRGDIKTKITEKLINSSALLYNSEKDYSPTLNTYTKQQIIFCAQVFSGLLNRVREEGDSVKFVHPINGIIFECVQGIASVNDFVGKVQKLGSESLEDTSKALVEDTGVILAKSRMQTFMSKPYFSNL